MLQAQLWNDAGLILFSGRGMEEAKNGYKRQAQGHESIESTKNLGHILASRQDFKGLLQPWNRPSKPRDLNKRRPMTTPDWWQKTA